MKSAFFVLLGVLSLGSMAHAIPGQDTFSKAEIRSILDHEPNALINRHVIFGEVKSIEFLGTGPTGVKSYQVISEQQGHCILVKAEVISEMAQPEGSARSSDDVVANLVSVSSPLRCLKKN